jgi:D-alanine--D-alanine ligase
LYQKIALGAVAYTTFMLKIIILYGGRSSERTISLRSGQAVYDAIADCPDYDARLVDYDGTFEAAVFTGIDIVFIALHGSGGEDGAVQAQLDAIGVSYVGTGSEASARCFNKATFREFCLQHTIPIPAGTVVDATSFWNSEITKQPFVLKPIDGGSSIDTFIIRDVTSMNRQQLIEAFERNKTMLLEQLIPGVEITVGVLQNRVLPVVEIIPPHNGEFDYINKYNGKSQELCPPRNVRLLQQRQAQQLALRIHELSNCQDFSRTDMIVSESCITVLETNTLPGMTAESLYPFAVRQAGLDMRALVRTLIDSALMRRNR